LWPDFFVLGGVTMSEKRIHDPNKSMFEISAGTNIDGKVFLLQGSDEIVVPPCQARIVAGWLCALADKIDQGKANG
jgi:hypothetical protein